MSISDFRFDVVMPGQHNHYRAAAGQATSPEMLQTIQIDWSKNPLNYYNPIFNISLAFFNRKESFTLFIYVEGTLDKFEFAVAWRAWTYKSEAQGVAEPKVDQ